MFCQLSVLVVVCSSIISSAFCALDSPRSTYSGSSHSEENSGPSGVNFESWISKKSTNSSKKYFKSGTVYDSLVTDKFTVVSFGYIPRNKFPDWVYHAFDRRFNNHTKSAQCSVELLALESISGRTIADTHHNGSTLQVPISSDSNDTVTFLCMHFVTQNFVRIPRAMGSRVPHNMPFWCLAPPSNGDQELEERIDQTCAALRSSDLRLELFVKPQASTVPHINITTHFTTTMGSYPVASRPDLSQEIVIHAVMPYHRVDRFNKIVFHMWLSYHALLGFHVVSSIPNMDFYHELPRHVANHPNIAHYDSSILRAVKLDSSSLYSLPYVVEFEKMMLATWVRFEYRVLYGSRFVVNADPDEFLMAPHGPGFDKFHFSPFRNYSQASHDCDPNFAKASRKPNALSQNAMLVEQYLLSMSKKSPPAASAAESALSGAPRTARSHALNSGQTNFVPFNLTDWTWTSEDLEGIRQQGQFIKWVVSDLFALSVNPATNRTNLVNFKGKGLEVVVHKEYVSTENTTTACIEEMLGQPRRDVYTFNKCFNYLSILHPGTTVYATVRSKYININQPCVTDTIHYGCVRNNAMKVKNRLSSSHACMCYRVENQPFLFLLHFRENAKSGGHPLHQIMCSLPDHEDNIISDFKKYAMDKHPYEY